eukprot:TRINITY_DN93162_c0_g1_i1.p1 TRINITY_DN93162_c0_g1~~TRINITY_DN93162_c0_g1_i1.p1  ORF type:complete len:355 (+),score=39.24 TRINITY_DN93162_c0_g1_i1:101-1066(+)
MAAEGQTLADDIPLPGPQGDSATSATEAVLSGSAEDVQIVFLHGLEGGPAGRKGQFLRRIFGSSEKPTEHYVPEAAVPSVAAVDDAHGSDAGIDPAATDSVTTSSQHRVLRTQVFVPDLEMSVYDVSKQNSLPRKWFRLSSCLEGCAETAEAAINELLPDNNAAGKKFLLMGSSWGGATAIKVLQRGRIPLPNKVVLFAPAFGAHGLVAGLAWPKLEIADDLFLNALAQEESCRNRSGKFMTVVHGDADDTCPVELSREFAQRFPEFVHYIEIPGGDHRLNAALRIPPAHSGGGSGSGINWDGPAYHQDMSQVVLDALAEM